MKVKSITAFLLSSRLDARVHVDACKLELDSIDELLENSQSEVRPREAHILLFDVFSARLELKVHDIDAVKHNQTFIIARLELNVDKLTLYFISLMD